MRTLIIDDERLARKELQSLLKDFAHIEVIGECSNAEEAKKKIEQLHPELIFLDIQMPGKTGFELLEDLEYMPKVIFCTAYDEFAIKAFEVNALDYLVKPVEVARLEQTIKKLVDDEEQGEGPTRELYEKLEEDDQIFLKDGEKCWFVQLKDVKLFESEGNYVRVFFKDQKPLILKSLNNLETRLDGKVFFRANRKHLINLKWVVNIESWFNGGLQVELKDGEKIEISRRQSAKFRDLMSL
ncbi:MAG: two-component system LytT family response regulator [Sphingobacteriales bacterium]|jgi:two-component system LytT family response regulator